MKLAILNFKVCKVLTFWALGEHAGQPLDAHLKLDVPDTQHLVLREGDELPPTLVKLHLHDTGHVTPQDLEEGSKVNRGQEGQRQATRCRLIAFKCGLWLRQRPYNRRS